MGDRDEVGPVEIGGLFEAIEELASEVNWGDV